jgi:MoxR-like ATPase
MPRTAGSKSGLRKINDIYIPTTFVQDLSAKNVSRGILPLVVQRFKMEAEKQGWTQDKLYNNFDASVHVAAGSSLTHAYKEACKYARVPTSGWTGTPKAVINPDEYEEVVPPVNTVQSVSMDAAIPEAVVQAAKDIVFDARNHAGPGVFITNEELFHGFRRVKDNPEPYKMPFKYVNPGGQADRIMDIIARGTRPVALIGHTGTGKSTLPLYCAQEMGLNITLFGCTQQTDVVDLLGSYLMFPDPVTGQTVSVFQPGPLVRAYERGEILVVDEYTALKQGIQMVFQQVNNGDPLLVSTRGDGYIAKKHPNFRVIFTANPSSYAGCNELGTQMVNRPFVFEVDYVDAKTETEILTKNYPSLKKADASSLVKFAGQSRKRLELDPTTKYVVATRDLVKIAELMTEYNYPLRDSVEIGVLNAVKQIDADEYDAMKTLVRDFFPAI